MRLKAEYKLDSAVLLLAKARSMFTPGSVEELLACNMLGDTYKYDLHDFTRAEEIFERSLAIQQKLDPSNTLALITTYYDLATTNRSQHDYETALSWGLKCLDGSLRIRDNTFTEYSYSIIGSVYRDMHEFDSAVMYYKKGVDLDERINHGKPSALLASFYSNWGETSYMQNDLDEAARKLRYAVVIYEKIIHTDMSTHFHTVLLLASVQTRRNDPVAAEALLESADRIRKLENLERGGQVSSLYKTYGDLYWMKSMNDKAVELYDKALVAAGDLKDYAYVAMLGKARASNGKSALECYAKAEKLMIANRAELDTEGAKWNYVDANYRLYENILSTMYNMSDRDEAQLFQFMENSRSKSLSDALREAEQEKAIGRNDTLLAKLQELRQRSISIQHQINERNDNASHNELILISQKISQFEDAISLKYPSYLKTRSDNSTVSINALKEKLNNIDAVFVEYFWGEHNVYSVVITADTVEFHLLAGSADTESLITKYLSFLTSKGNRYSTDAVHEFSGLSNKLYSLLLDNYQDKRLIIIPDGPLMQLPFETLVTKPGGDSYNQLSYLLNDHIISYESSASHLLATRQAPKNKPSLLAFGFTGGANERSVEASKVEIAGTETELIALSDKFPNGTFLYGDGVTEKNFKDKAANYDLLHLAVHGSGDIGKDYSATLYFRDKGDPEDGRLYWYELYSMNLHASLAVLSSCESGIGKNYRGEGMLSMANAFTFAGCDNIVMGLWKVDDQVSVKLMDTFYNELLDGMAIDEALAIAKRTYLASADQISANPKLWGSLVAYGESPILKADKIPMSWVVIALLVLGTAIVILVVNVRIK
ncbi:MAG: CHAT domain-containing tetratricopeptide repeat protein [Bacteroidota bacterium]